MNRHSNGRFRGTFRVGLIGILALGLSGCILRLTGGFAFTDDLGTFIDFIFEDVSTAYCRDIRDPETGDNVVECDYFIATEDGFGQRTSTAKLISNFGIFGILVDPLIVQVDESATFENATVDAGDGNGRQDLVVTETTVFDVQPGVQSTAEPGRKFWIIELPQAVLDIIPQASDIPPQPRLDLDYTFDYRSLPEPDNVATFQAVFAGRVDIGGNTFYIPLYPCTSDFSQVPDIDVPMTNDLFGLIFDLLFTFGDFGVNPDLGCQDQVYDFTGIGVNAPPEADAGPDQVVQCTSLGGTDITLDGTGSFDPDGDQLTFEWTNSFGAANGPTPTISLPPGTQTISLLVEDGQGGADTDTVDVTVESMTDPSLVISLTPICTPEDDDDECEDDDDEQRFLVGMQCVDVCDATPALMGTINGTSVSDGEVFVVRGDDDGPNTLTLKATCEDGSGNTVMDEVTVLLGESDDDDEDSDDEDSDDEDSDDEDSD